MSKGSADRTRDRKAFRENHPGRRPGKPGRTVYVVRDGRLVEKPILDSTLLLSFEMCWDGMNPAIGNEWKKIARVPLHPDKRFGSSWIGEGR